MDDSARQGSLFAPHRGGVRMELPSVFDHPNAAFVFLPKGIKYPPMEKAWQKKNHNFQEAVTHVAKGGNVGIIAGIGYIGFDKDDPSAFKGLKLPKTTLWETRPSRFGCRFKCSDVSETLVKYDFKPDHSQIKLYDTKQIHKNKMGRDVFKHVGEIKLQRTYQVIPPSWKTLENGNRAEYRLLDEAPPADRSASFRFTRTRYNLL